MNDLNRLFENLENIKKTESFVPLPRNKHFDIIEKYIELGYGAPYLFYSWYYISIFKIQWPDQNHSTRSSYWNVLGDQILHFLEFFYYLLSHFENHRSDGLEIFTVFTVHSGSAIFKVA